MIAMGRGLGLTVVAEGVETEMQREYLTKKGCTQLQGYLFSRPVDATELVAWAERLDAQTLDNQHGAWPKATGVLATKIRPPSRRRWRAPSA